MGTFVLRKQINITKLAHSELAENNTSWQQLYRIHVSTYHVLCIQGLTKSAAYAKRNIEQHPKVERLSRVIAESSRNWKEYEVLRV